MPDLKIDMPLQKSKYNYIAKTKGDSSLDESSLGPSPIPNRRSPRENKEDLKIILERTFDQIMINENRKKLEQSISETKHQMEVIR